MQKLKYNSLAIDFDGTIAYDGFWPELGGFKPHAVRVLKKIVEHGGKIIIWTCRTCEQADQVKAMLADAGVTYDAFNEQLKDTLEQFGDGRKVFADCYIDDRANFCEEIDWLFIESKLFIDVGEKIEA